MPDTDMQCSTEPSDSFGYLIRYTPAAQKQPTENQEQTLHAPLGVELTDPTKDTEPCTQALNSGVRRALSSLNR
jgi:hypothetical protein